MAILKKYQDKTYQRATDLVAKKAANMANAAPAPNSILYKDFISTRYCELAGYGEGLQDALGLSADWYTDILTFAASWYEILHAQKEETA